ncbi:UDP-N-acetylglucosamine pyrophosphorylase, partial [Tulasnella sp. 417]
MSSNPSVESVKERYEAAGQSQVFKFWEDLTPEQQSTYLGQLNSLDVERVNRIWKKAVD